MSTPADRSDVAMLARPIALLAEGATEPPRELRLFSSGLVDTTKGVFRVDDESCASVSRCYAELGRLVHMDWEHGSVFAMYSPDPRAAGKAAAHFEVECRNGEIWASNIQWTPAGREDVLSKSFRYTSPTFRHDDENRVLEVLSCALTNDPAIKRREPVVASREQSKEPTMKSVLSFLGLSEAATETATLSALTALVDGLKGQVSTLSAQVAAVTAEKATLSAQTVELAAKVQTLSTEKAALEQAATAREQDALIETACREGKLAPALKDWAKTLSVTSLKDFVAKAPKAIGAGGKATEPKDGGATATLSDAERKNLEIVHGIKPEDYLAHKQKLIASGAIRA